MSDQLVEREKIAAQFLGEAVRFLKSQKPPERNLAGIVISATAASFLTDTGLYQELEKIWIGTPTRDYGKNARLENVVSNTAKDCSRISREELVDSFRKVAPNHIETCSRIGITIDNALQTAATALAMEEIGCTFALLGKYELARKVAEQATLDDFRKENILWVIEAEKLREGDLIAPDFQTLGLWDWGTDPWRGGNSALCALGRQPYLGYPYPDW